MVCVTVNVTSMVLVAFAVVLAAARETPSSHKAERPPDKERLPVYKTNSAHNMAIQQRKRSCQNLGGRCMKRSKACHGHLPLEKPPGRPYCSKRRRCCYPALITFGDFTSKFHKSYVSEDEAKTRCAIFEENEKIMEDHNKLYETGNSSYIMGVNVYSDLTYDEVIRTLTGINGSNITDGNMRSDDYWYVPKQLGEEPLSMDYRERGAVNPIRDQGGCGSCWAFSSTSSIESNIFLKTGSLLQLSEQDLVDCSIVNGCKGGWPKNAIEYVKKEGIAYRDGYPYTATNNTCNKAPSKTFYVTGHKQVRSTREDELLNALVHIGPMSIVMYVSDNFASYKSGVFFDTKCTKEVSVNHAMTLVGYGTENGQDYWLVRNSWGDSWGDNGYIKVARNKGNHCWISSYADIPVIKDLSTTEPSTIPTTTTTTNSPSTTTTTTAEGDCGSEYTSSSGMLQHPMNGGNYEDNENCIWIIRTDAPIKITFVTFDLEYRYDYLFVRDGDSGQSSLIGNYTGESTPSSVQTSGKSAYLSFSSDSSATRTGFELQWSTAGGCGGEYTSRTGMLQHPLNGGNYEDNENCTWIIRTDAPINITFVTFDLENRYDYLFVRDGDSSQSSLLGNFTGESTPSSVQTSGNSVYLAFSSDYSATRTGFELRWSIAATIGCTQNGQLLPAIHDCSKYISCQYIGSGNYIEHTMSCLGGLYFNPETNNCDRPNNVPSCNN